MLLNWIWWAFKSLGTCLLISFWKYLLKLAGTSFAYQNSYSQICILNLFIANVSVLKLKGSIDLISGRYQTEVKYLVIAFDFDWGFASLFYVVDVVLLASSGFQCTPFSLRPQYSARKQWSSSAVVLFRTDGGAWHQ